MDRELFRDELEAVMIQYGLPAMPEYYDGPEARNLILFSYREPQIVLTQCSLEDAQLYCSRDDTRGDGWFTGFDRAGK